jgi:hypothetical protein
MTKVCGSIVAKYVTAFSISQLSFHTENTCLKICMRTCEVGTTLDTYRSYVWYNIFEKYADASFSCLNKVKHGHGSCTKCSYSFHFYIDS